MEGDGCCGSFIQRCKPYIAIISLQFGYAGMNIITKVALNRGMSHYVLVVYRHVFATAAIAPFALVLERKVRPKITFLMFMQMFMLGLLGPVIDQNLYYAGLKFTSPTYSCAISNMLPAMTFVMAVICRSLCCTSMPVGIDCVSDTRTPVKPKVLSFIGWRMEKADIRKVTCQAKVIGTVVTVAGAMLMALYKGKVINYFWSQYMHHPRNHVPENTSDSGEKDWVKGSILLMISTLAWAAFFILQAVTLRRYSAPFSLTAIVCFLGTLQSTVVTFVVERKVCVWFIDWNMNLFAAAYTGIVCSSIAYYVQGIVMQKRGPIFVTAFNPLVMIIVAIMDSFILAGKIYLGGVIGAIMILIGLYSVLWGKYKEHKEIEAEVVTEAIKCRTEKGMMQMTLSCKREACKESRISISVPKA